MQDLINQLKEQFDLSDEKASEILNTVVGTIRDKLPEPIASKLDGLLDGEGFDLAELTNELADNLSGMKDSLTSQLPDGLEEKASGMLGKLFSK